MRRHNSAMAANPIPSPPLAPPPPTDGAQHVILGYMRSPRSPGPAPQLPHARHHRHASRQQRSSSTSSSDGDDDLSARPPFGPAELAQIESMLSSLSGRQPVPDSWWASVGLRRTALRYAREETTTSGGGSADRADAAAADAHPDLRRSWDDLAGVLARFRAAVDRVPSAPVDGPDFVADPRERIRRLREELERLNDAVDESGASGAAGGAQRESHL